MQLTRTTTLFTLLTLFIYYLLSSGDDRDDLQSDLQQLKLLESSDEISLTPNLRAMTFRHKHYYQEYSFSEWEWSSFRQLFVKSRDLCQRNESFARAWTLPVKCEYYLIIRALRAAKDRESELNEKEKALLLQYEVEIYGKSEDYEALKERLTSPFLSEDSQRKNFRLKTVLETNEVDHLLTNRVIAQERVLERCATSVLADGADVTFSSSGSQTLHLPRLSIAFLYYLPHSSYREVGGRRVSDLPFFRNFVRSLLHATQRAKEREEGPWSLSLSLYVGYDVSSDRSSDDTGDSLASFVEDFHFACSFLDLFEEVTVQGYDVTSSWNHDNQDHYLYHSVVSKGETALFFLPFVFKQLIKSALTRSEGADRPDYFYFIRDSLVIPDDFFRKTLSPLRQQNHLLPNLGLSLDLARAENDVIALHSDFFAMMTTFPLSINILNTSYLNLPSERLSWNHFYFTLIDIFSVFQPSLRQNNDFLLSQKINHSLVTSFHSQNNALSVISAQFAANIERYKVLVERARRHIGKWLHENEQYIQYHTCINDIMNEVFAGKQDYYHPIQFYWRPNQLIYEINGIFSVVNF